MAVFETFLEKLIRGEIDASEISTTLNRLINDDPTLTENLEKLIGQYNAAHPSAPAPRQIVDYLLNEITRIHTITGGAAVNQPADEDNMEKTSIIGADDIADDEQDSEATTMLGDGDVIDSDATVANPNAPDGDATVANPDSDSTIVSPGSGGVATALDATSSSGTYVEATATSSDHMMINIGEEEDYDVDVGTLISGRYKVIEKLGEGGMGLVFKARDELMALAEDRNPYVAVKVLTKAFRQRRDAFIALQRETSKAQRLAHPNICTVFHFDKDGNTIYMTMELLNGVDLRDYINKHIKKPGKGYTMERAWPLIKGIADALSYAHKNNLIHSDLKPGNVYVVLDEKTGQETVKVIDFGIAQAIKPRDDSGELAGEVTKFDPKKLGALTPSYATVEMFNGMSPVQTDDIYALGCISYELLTGKRPYDRLTAKKAHLSKIKMPTVSLKNLGLTRRQEKGLIKASRLLREDRTRTLEDFIHDVAPRKSYVWQIAAGITGLVTLIGVLSIPSINAYFQDKYNAEVSARLNAPAPDVFGAALEELLAYEDPLERTKVSNLNRVVIQDTISEISVSFFKPSEGRYDYQSALQLSAKGLGLFPDSNTLQGLRQSMLAELNLENSELGNVLAESLKTRELLPKGDNIGAVGVLARAQTMDPANSLLRDPSLRFVFKEEAQKSIKSAQYDEAGQLIEFSSIYIADAATMPLYMGDKLTIARTAADRATQLKQAKAAVARADQMSLSDQAGAGIGLRMALLRQLSPADTTLTRAENNNDQRFN
nr:serine/threonine protein kinase [Pseudomonadota bacterium]